VQFPGRSKQIQSRGRQPWKSRSPSKSIEVTSCYKRFFFFLNWPVDFRPTKSVNVPLINGYSNGYPPNTAIVAMDGSGGTTVLRPAS